MFKTVAIVGGGPAGLMAAERLLELGYAVQLYDAMASVGRKFLQAGRGGLNITHGQSLELFIDAYGQDAPWLSPMIHGFDNQSVRDWVHGFGIDTFVGSSGRVFPTEKKAAPLLRAWLHRLKNSGRFVMHVKHRLIAWDESLSMLFQTPLGEKRVSVDAIVLALGGASWPQLGSDGRWVEVLVEKEIAVTPLQASNCGFNANWSDYIKVYAGQPIKPVVVHWNNQAGDVCHRKGELMLTESGLEGGLLYALSRDLRYQLEHHNAAELWLDLLPDWTDDALCQTMQQMPSHKSLSKRLKDKFRLSAVKLSLIQEVHHQQPDLPVSSLLKKLPITLTSTRPIAEAISSAGGVQTKALDERLMLNRYPGIFCAGEMLDWDAPTGGYLLTACLATGKWAAEGVDQWLKHH